MDNQSQETYLNHPTFGLLYRVCLIQDDRELFTTLYAQRLFFIVTFNDSSLIFEPISRSDARILVETRLRRLRNLASSEKYQQLQAIYKRTFL
ncbi:MAG: PipX family protein [Xenococcaceae cyanobacterium MO_188.B32]|nr:PipX family protein [Xenococcaceae cyanobacterium MO_188.B32]